MGATPFRSRLSSESETTGQRVDRFFQWGSIICLEVLELWRARYLGAGVYDCEVTQTDQFSRRRRDKSLFDSDIAQCVIPGPHRCAGYTPAGIHSPTPLDTCLRRYDKALSRYWNAFSRYDKGKRRV